MTASQGIDNTAARLTTSLEQMIELVIRLQSATDSLEMLNLAVEAARHLLGCDRVLAYQLLPQGDGVILAESVGAQWDKILGRLIYDPC